jgi:hypothetical protein
MTAPLTVPEVLRRAEQIIGERGWCQGDYTDELGHVCTRGAINVVVSGEPFDYNDDEHELREPLAVASTLALARYLNGVGRAVEGSSLSDVSDWNDELDRNEADVRAALLAAADRAEATT